MFTFKNHPQSIWGIIADSLRLYRASISKIWYWQLIFALALALVGAPFGVLHTSINPTPATFFTAGHFTSSIIVTSAAGFTLLISLFILVMGQCFIYSRMQAVATDTDTRIKTSMRLAFRKTPAVLAAMFILALIIVLIFVAISLFEIAIMKVVTFQSLIAIVDIIVMYALTIIIAILTILFPLFILIENNGVFRALKNSVTHMQKNFWRTLGLFMLVSLAIILIMPGILLSTTKLLVALPQSSPTLGIIGALGFLILYALIYAFTSPILNALLLTLFHDVKVRKAS